MVKIQILEVFEHEDNIKMSKENEVWKEMQEHSFVAE